MFIWLIEFFDFPDTLPLPLNCLCCVCHNFITHTHRKRWKDDAKLNEQEREKKENRQNHFEQQEIQVFCTEKRPFRDMRMACFNDNYEFMSCSFSYLILYSSCYNVPYILLNFLFISQERPHCFHTHHCHVMSFPKTARGVPSNNNRSRCESIASII